MQTLTPKELTLLKLVCDDKNNSEIAAKMKFGLRYTEKIKTKLYHKTKTKSGIGLLKWAVLNKYYVIKKKKK